MTEQHHIDRSSLVVEQNISGDTALDTQELRCMLQRAKEYLLSHEWCPKVVASYMGFAIPGVIALFLFELEEAIEDRDRYLWVVVGDLPSAYLVVDNAPNAACALECYCELMQAWVDAVRNDRPVIDAFPVSAPADRHHAEMLSSRIDFIRKKIMPLVHSNH